jgi:hypothetical protein
MGVGVPLDLDVILTGTTRSEFEEVNRQLYASGSPTSEIALHALQMEFKRQPCMGDARYLRHVTFEVNDHAHVHLTDIGGYFGLGLANEPLEFELKTKHTLKSSSAHRPHYSQDCRALIDSALGHVSVISW